MATLDLATERPRSPEEAAELLRGLGEQGRVVRVRGGGTKLDWGGVGDPVAVELETAGLDRIVEHNVGDFTAILQAGVPLAKAQERFHAEGQMLALDPPLAGGAPGRGGGGGPRPGPPGPPPRRPAGPP